MNDSSGLKRFLVMIEGNAEKLGRLAGDFETYEKAIFYVAKNVTEGWYIWDLTKTQSVTDSDTIEA